ncbi:MAG: RNA polymerase sigma factor [Candidatus Limnocylindrales bacterium]
MIETEQRPTADTPPGSRTADEAARTRAFLGLLDRRALDAAYRYATLILGDRLDAEDAAHDAALAAWRRFSELRDPGRFDAWFGRILVNTCRDRLRARRRSVHEILDEETAGLITDPAGAIARQQAIARAMQTLSADHREVIVLRFYADLTVDEIAQRTGVGAGTVKSRLHYALRHLRDALGSEDEEMRHER